MIFVATKKGKTTNFFSPLSFVAVFGYWIQDPGWTKIRIRDKHPESATLKQVAIFPGRTFIPVPYLISWTDGNKVSELAAVVVVG